MLKENKPSFRTYLFGLLIGLLICFISLRYFILSEGLAFWQDLYWVYDPELYPKYLWNEYTQTSAVPNHIIGKYWLYVFPPEIAERLIFVVIFSISGLSMFYVTYRLTASSLASLIATMLFIINPIVIMRLGHWLLLWYYSFLPTLFYCALSAFNNVHRLSTLETLKASIYISLILFLMSPSVRIPYYFLIIPLTFFICLSHPYKRYLKKSLYLITLIITIYLLLSSIWLLPLIFERSFAPTNYVVTSEVLSLLSRNSEISKVFSLQSFWAITWFNEVFTLSKFKFLWNLALFSIPILAFSSLLLRKDKITLYLALFSLVIIFLAKGVQQPFGEFYEWLVFDSPLLSKFGWQFRGPNKWNLLLMFTYSILAGLTISEIFKKLKNTGFIYKYIKYIFILVLFAIPLIAGYPLLTGDLNGKLRPQPVPDDYRQLDQWLREQGTDFKVAVYPSPPPWGVIKPTIRYDLYWRFSVDSLLNDKTNKFGALLNPWSVKYIIVRTEPSKSEAELRYFLMMFKQSESFINSLRYQDDIKFVKKFETLYVFENLDYSAPICVSKNNLAILDDLNVLNSLTQVNLLPDKKLVSIYFLSQNVKTLFNFIAYDKIILNENIIYRYIVHSHNSKIIKPFDATIHHNPSKLWSKAMTSDPLHGEWHPYLEKFGIKNWQSDYGYGLVFTWAKNTKLEIPFSVDKSDNYKLLIRYFKNQKGGEIKVYLDGKPIEIKTKDQLNKFVWKELGTFYLEKGKHEIVLENVNGFNAVNLFVLIPEKEYYKAKEEVEKLLQNKTVIYLFEAESDLYRSNAKISKNPEASNGELILLGKNGKVWQDVEIVKNGTYKIALRGTGEFKVKIGDKSFILKSNNLNFTYSPPFYLSKGKYRLEITPLNVKNLVKTKLDVIWLYSSNRTIDQLFEVKEKPAKIISYEKINPTLWKVKVNATKPFMLSFAEAYDPLWEARIYKDGKLVEKVRSIPLYSVINGFWINETGNLEIVIRYTPQDWFELGLRISGLTFIGCIGYLFYDWRREKEDEWALIVERKIRNVLKKIYKR